MTDLITDIKKKLIEKNLSNTSINMYLRNIEKLNDKEKVKNFKFLENVDAILEKLNKYKPNTIRNYLISITSILNIYKDINKNFEKLYKKYYDIMMDKNKQIKEEQKDQKKSDTQSKNWLTWNDVLKRYKEIYNDVKSFVNKKELNEIQYNKLLALIIFSFYVLIPPRRNQDYQLLYLVKKATDDLDNDKNYISYDDNKIIFNVYKTSKKYDTQEITYDDSLKAILDLYIKHHPLLKGQIPETPTKLLVYNNGSGLDQVNSITNILNRLFEKNISSSMLRHIYLTSKYGDILEQQKKDAEEMGHNLQTQKDYIKTD